MATALSFPTISGVTTPPYLSALTETANIQNTINFLYYGSADSGTTPRTSLSTSSGIYGMLAQLQTQISAVQSGVNVHESAKWATATTLAAVYANGTADASNGTGIGATITFSATGVQKIDSTTTDIAINDRVLVKNGTTALSGTSSTANGIYYVSTAPAIGVAGILTRALDSDNSIAGEMAEGDFLYVAAGDTNANEGFILTSSSTTGTGPAGSIRIGTDGVTYTQFIGVGSYFLGTTAAQISSANQVVTGILSLAMPGSTSGTITLTPAATAGTTAITIPAVAGTLAINPTTTIGDVIYASATGTPGTLTRLAGNITVQPSFLSSTGNASANTTTAFTSSTGSGNVVLVTSPTFATSILGGASMDVFHTGTTTLNFGGAVTSLSIGNTATAAQTVNMFTAATAGGTYNIATAAASSGTKAINIGTAGGAGSTTTITIGTTAGTTPTIALNGAVTLGTTGLVGPATMAAFNTASTNLSIGGAATTMTLGSTSAGTSTVQAGTTLNLNAPAVNGNASTLTLFGTPTTVTAFGAATALTIGNAGTGNKTLTLQSGSSSGTSTINIGTGSVSTGGIVLNLGTATISGGSVTVNIGSSTSTTTIAGTVINSGDGVILKTASFTVGAGERNYNVTGTASVTVTLPTATAGRTINIVNKATFTIVSASSNVMPRTGTQTLGTAICAAVVGSFATLVADGTNWYIMAGA